MYAQVCTLIIYLVTDCVRLYLGYSGNLLEKVLRYAYIYTFKSIMVVVKLFCLNHWYSCHISLDLHFSVCCRNYQHCCF